MKELRITTQDQIQLTVTINPSGFVKVSDGQRTKSMALPSFARAYFMNPSAVTVQPAVQSATITLPDGSEWIVHADALIITRAEKVEPVSVEVRSEPEGPQEVRVEVIAAQVQPQQQEVVSMSQNGKMPRWAAALQSILKTQGFSDDQIAEIIAAVSKDSRRRPERESFDASTPEGRLMLALKKLWQTSRKCGVTSSVLQSPDGFEIRYANGVVYLYHNNELIARYPTE